MNQSDHHIPKAPLYTTSFHVNAIKPQSAIDGAMGGISANILNPVQIKAMTGTLTKKETLDDKVERYLSVLAEDMIDDVIDFACRLAKHRGSNSLNRNDVRLAFEKRLKVRVPAKQQSSAAAMS